MRESAKRTEPTTIAAKRINITPNAETWGIQPLPQNCQTTVDMTTLLRVSSVNDMVTSRYASMPIQIQLLSTPAAMSGKTILPKTRGAEAPETRPASSSSRWT